MILLALNRSITISATDRLPGCAEALRPGASAVGTLKKTGLIRKLPPLAAINLLWLIMSPEPPGWRIWLGAYYVVHGILIFGIGVGTTDMMLGSSGHAYRSAYINVSFVINTLAVGIAPFLGTLVTRVAGDWSGHWGWFWLDGNRLVFIVRCFLMLLPLFMVGGISRRHGGEVRPALAQMARSARRWVDLDAAP